MQPVTKRRRHVVLAGAALFIWAIAAPSLAQLAKVPARNNRGTVLIQVNWVTGGTPESDSGAGFVLSADGDILTVAHHFPRL